MAADSMSDPKYFVVRRPRHSAINCSPSQVWLERSSAQTDQQRDAQLVDFSRKGAKFELSAPLRPEESFRARIKQDANSVDITLPAVVRWQRADADGKWTMGCLFEHQGPYVVVGELFLCGLLSTEPG